MEEDIKKIEEFINDIEECGLNDCGRKYFDFNLLRNLLTRYKQLEEGCKTCVIREDLHNYVENSIPKSKIKEKIDEQLKEASDVLDNENYLDNFNGNKDEQEYYYEGYRDATLFLQELLEEE